jgi:hypothetical protein
MMLFFASFAVVGEWLKKAILIFFYESAARNNSHPRNTQAQADWLCARMVSDGRYISNIEW